MAEVQVSQLKRAVESQHSCTAELVQAVPVKETFDGKTVWEGVVHVFKMYGHPKAKKAYAWSSPIEGSNKRRFFAVLHLPPITSPAEEENAVLGAGARARGGSIYVFGKPICARCAGTIIQSGVSRVVAEEPKKGTRSKWDKSGRTARKMLDEAKIQFVSTSN